MSRSIAAATSVHGVPRALAFGSAFLVIGHFVMDFVLQGDGRKTEEPAVGRRSRRDAREGRLLETSVHWVTDVAKCCRKIDVHTDQAIHVACKVVWLVAWRLACRAH